MTTHFKRPMLIYKLNYNEPLEMASPFHYYTAIFSQIFDLVNARYGEHLKGTLKKLTIFIASSVNLEIKNTVYR